jgi:dipeptidyl aminopeptidase/acylaminoacyl peptidase
MKVRHNLTLVAFCFCTLCLSTGPLVAQDGRIVARDTVQLSDEARQRAADQAAEFGVDLNEVLQEVVVQRVTYLSDGLRVQGYLVEPISGDDLPAIIFNRGGNRDFGALGDLRAIVRLGALARHGYVVVASQYRGNAGGDGREEFGGADVNDVLNLIPLLEQHPRVDDSLIGMYGWSRGGMMTYLAMARTDRIRAAVVGAGLSDAFDTVARRPEMEDSVMAQLVPNWATQRAVALEARSAVRWPERLYKGTPILLLHGGSDWRVHPIQALEMARALYEARHPFRLVFFEGDDHGLTGNRGEVDRLVIDWFNRYVRDKAPLPNLEPHGR